MPSNRVYIFLSHTREDQIVIRIYTNLMQGNNHCLSSTFSYQKPCCITPHMLCNIFQLHYHKLFHFCSLILHLSKSHCISNLKEFVVVNCKCQKNEAPWNHSKLMRFCFEFSDPSSCRCITQVWTHYSKD